MLAVVERLTRIGGVADAEKGQFEIQEDRDGMGGDNVWVERVV